MVGSYNITLEGDVLKVGFGSPAENTEIVRDAVAAVKALNLQGGKLLKINGSSLFVVGK
ncbi:MAG: hypothetical protein MNSN_05980 [Minisyncoccus archaeiphilus]|uniref:hypothetical protein n=1 Tax=Minisyncoccus archaeiphilus TaxID=3238481 RepID=UPI002B0B47A4|nr:MAG: hypothetical protein MNSN_05980 [Candidatus Parcubacteria bacterium]